MQITFFLTFSTTFTHPIDQDGYQERLSLCVHHLLFRIIQQEFVVIVLIYTFDEIEWNSNQWLIIEIRFKEISTLPDIWNKWSFDRGSPAHRSEYKSPIWIRNEFDLDRVSIWFAVDFHRFKLCNWKFHYRQSRSRECTWTAAKMTIPANNRRRVDDEDILLQRIIISDRRISAWRETNPMNQTKLAKFSEVPEYRSDKRLDRSFRDARALLLLVGTRLPCCGRMRYGFIREEPESRSICTLCLMTHVVILNNFFFGKIDK